MQNSSQSHPQQGPRSHACMLDAALDYISRGWRVLPLHNITLAGSCTCGHRDCRQRGKHPRLLLGLKDATNEEKRIRQWWQQEPQANIGIATGQGLLVVHVDPRRGGSLQELIEFYALPPTATVSISNGGWHLYFTYNEALTLRCNSGKLGEGIDCKGEGGYVIAPPSALILESAGTMKRGGERGNAYSFIAPSVGDRTNGVLEGHSNEEYRYNKHIRDQNYSWLNNLEAEMLPAVLLPTLLNTRPLHTPPSWKSVAEEPSATVSRIVSWQSAEDPTPLQKPLLHSTLSSLFSAEIVPFLEPGQIIPEAERAISLTSIAGSLRRLGASEEVLRIALDAFNRRQCQPPLAQEELGRITRWALRWKVDRPPVPASPFQLNLNTMPIRFDALLASPPPEPAWTIPGLLPEGVTLLAGKSRAGKSGLALQIALALTNNTPLLDKFPTRQGEVLFLGLEDSMRHMYDRLRRLLQGRPAPRSCTWAGTWGKLRSGGLADLEDWLESHPATRLIVIDSLASVHDSVTAPGRLHIDKHESILPLKQISRQYHSSILLTHHLHQSRTVSEYRDEMCTSTATDASIDCCMLLQREYGQAQTELHVIGHDLEEQRFHLKTDERTAGLTIADNNEYKRIL